MVNFDLGLLDKKNKGLKNLSLLQGFNLADPPVKINDNLQITNSITLDNKDVIDEKIFIKFFGLVDNSKEGNVEKENKKTRKKRAKKDNKDTKKDNKDTKKNNKDTKKDNKDTKKNNKDTKKGK
jgi:hypothetical protein